MNERKKSVKKTVLNVCVAVIVALMVLTLIIVLLNKDRDKPLFIGGKALLWVKTGSIEPTIEEKSYITVKKYNGGATVGDVIVFICKDVNSAAYGSLITHRVTAVTEEGYKTKGDNSFPDTWTVKEEDIVAVYSNNMPVLTVAGRVFSSPAGIILIAVLFFGSTAFLYIPDIINALKDEDKEKAEKERLINEKIAEEVQKMCDEDAKKGEK